MARLDPTSSFEALKARTIEAVSGQFPYEGSRRRLVLHKTWIEDDKDIDDIRSQLAAKLRGRTWGVPLKAEIELIDKQTGQRLDKSVVTLAKIPKITRRHSYIVDGKERQVDTQLRLKSGAYHREDEAGRLQTHWNIKRWPGSKAVEFYMHLDPKTRDFRMSVGTTTAIGLYPVLRALGVGDDAIKKTWGAALYDASAKKYGSDKQQLQSLNKFLGKTTGDPEEDLVSAQAAVRAAMEKAELRPDSTEITLGKRYTTVNGEAMLRSSKKMLGISRGEEKQDDREAMYFKDVLSIEDHIEDRLVRKGWEVRKRLRNTVDTKDEVRQIVTPAVFGKPIDGLFKTTLAQLPDQTNPLEFISGAARTTLLGDGGIGEIRAVPEAAKAVNPSTLGYLDPIPTPEGEKTGITLQVPLGAKKVGKTLKIRAYSRKTGKSEWLDPRAFDAATVAFADQVKWVNGRPLPRNPSEVAVAAAKGNNIEIRPYKDVTHVLHSTKGLFSLSTNLMPFLQNNQGNRAMTASRQQEQAIALSNPEAPLVRSAVEGGRAISFEDILGKLSSHKAPVSGTVDRIKADAIIIKDSKGKKHEVQLYDNFPLNADEHHIHSTPRVSKGDKVAEGQLLADTNFTDNGTLALGRNLRIAYMPFRGYNFEDGAVISESAAKKLTSVHLRRPSASVDRNSVLNKRKYLAYVPPDTLTKLQQDKLDDDGVIREGEVVAPGDILIAKLQREEITTEQQRLQALKKSLVKPYRNRAVSWKKDSTGVVTRVVRNPRSIEVHVKTDEPAKIGDKIVGRHGNKGIISLVVPDHEMPKFGNGQHIEVALNPAGIPSRINLGQVLETVASKIARKTGKPYLVDNFPSDIPDYTRKIQKELKEHGLSDTSPIFHPATGKKMGDVLSGEQYILKQKHHIDKKVTARGGGVGNPYSVNRTPSQGGDRGGQALSALGAYSMLAHGARANLREMQTLKSDLNDDLWTALQAGEALPPPKPPYTYEKFKGYLNVMGINVEKEGNSLNLVPLTDAQVRDMSHGEVKDAGKMFRGKDMRPEKGGLFDEEVTGGPNGDRWSHIELSNTMPNPVFEHAISSLLGIKQKDIPEIVGGTQSLNGATGPGAVVDALGKLDIGKELTSSMAKLKVARKDELDRTRRRVRYLQALQKTGLSPTEAYTTKAVPVLPPMMRPVSVLDNGSLSMDDINGLYKGLSLTEQQLKSFDPALPPEGKDPLRRDIYDGLKALTMNGGHVERRHYRGVMATIKGTAPKHGFFQKKMFNRKQDLSMRSTIIPEQSMSLDEVGLPKKAAMEMYKPFVVREMVKGFGYTPLQAKKAIKENHEIADRALGVVASQRPVLLKRDPSLHKHSILAFKPKIVSGKAIQIHPLVTGGFNADFDGDTMAIFVPLTTEAVIEARKMFPSNNLFNEGTGKIVHLPGQEAQLGVFQLSEWGRRRPLTFDDDAAVMEALKDGKISASDVIKVKEPSLSKEADAGLVKEATMETTPGRMLLAKQFAPGSAERQRVLTDKSLILDKRGTREILTGIAKTRPKEFAATTNRLNQLGNRFTYDTAYSIDLDDFLSMKDIRDPLIARADSRVNSLKKSGMSHNDAVIEAYTAIIPELDKRGKAAVDKRRKNRMYEMVRSGARGSWTQFKQITVAPILVTDTDGKPVPIPIKKSYSEGLSAPEYWASLSGARMGTLSKAQGTSAPGELTKDVVNVSMGQLVLSDDCGTHRGISMHIDDPEVHDRYLAGGMKVRNKTIPANTLVTPEILSTFRNAKIRKITVRSPLKCEHGRGLCSKCYGKMADGNDPSIGTNLGVIAAQSIGEPATQLSMNAFHTGGVVTPGSSMEKMDSFKRLSNLLNMPENLKGSATISTVAGKVTKRDIKSDPAGGWRVTVRGTDRRKQPVETEHYVPGNRLLLPEMEKLQTTGGVLQVRAGQALSAGQINPKELLDAAGIEAVRSYITDEMYDAYKDVGPVKRKNMEVVVRALTNLTRVEDPGDSDFLRGDVTQATRVAAHNRDAVKKGKAPIKHAPILRGVSQVTLDMHEDWLARMQYQKLENTVLEGAAQGWKSNIHGEHPVPGLVYGAEFGQSSSEMLGAY